MQLSEVVKTRMKMAHADQLLASTLFKELLDLDLNVYMSDTAQ